MTKDRKAGRIRRLAVELGCGTMLVGDMLTLAGGDEELVREASETSMNVGQMKSYIIDRRFRAIEERKD